MPNDEAEQTRLSIVHQAFLMLLVGDLTKAPVPQGPSRILDVGTGPGDWAVEMGERYPDAEIIATDISVFDAGPGIFGLPNVQFQIDDAEEEWTYHEPFDLIHFRGLSGSFRDWIAVYSQALKHLKAGGYIEVVEWDPAMDILSLPAGDSNSYLNILISAMRNMAEATGYSRGQDHLQSSSLTSVGFVDVRQYDISAPIGTWPEDPRQKTLGKMTLIALLEGLEARSLRQLTASGKWTVEEVRDLCEKVKLEIVSSEGASMSVRFLTGRKPMSAAPARVKYQRKINKILREIEKSHPSVEQDQAV
jgi:SAM-dependent methyltransferase